MPPQQPHSPRATGISRVSQPRAAEGQAGETGGGGQTGATIWDSRTDSVPAFRLRVGQSSSSRTRWPVAAAQRSGPRGFWGRYPLLPHIPRAPQNSMDPTHSKHSMCPGHSTHPTCPAYPMHPVEPMHPVDPPCTSAPLGSEGWLGEPPSRRDPANQEAMLRVLDAGLERCLALHSAVQCIPVPQHRKLSGKAGIDEVMAAAVLTSLSASPLVLGHPPATHAPAEPGSEVWKEAPTMSSSCSSSSNTSGDWSWDPSSDRSTPSTPSPPLSSHVPSTFLPGPLPDDGPDEPDGTHFVFGEPTPRKRKNSTKVMFKCLWKSCGKVLSSSSGMQKHIRTVHLGRKADLEQSDGEEDFYYTELDVDVDALTDGLSSLTPVSPTSSVPPAFPGPEAPPPPALPILDLALASPCSPPPPPGRCHVHTDHAYQGCRTPPRPPVSPTVPTPPPPKPPAVPRRPRGEAKKCRKVYGMEHREMWCTACRWKKACQRFLD
ncbi:LOW QUALITY PROTEIN: SLC2A4 regulator [Corvus kubaryi]|uniref:LOW QUALITY PROTEIN: SLC2A4 regulator n=1 Tax=Corvus kubaryi TaxID=68294 RepID=UPI001C05431B|nr:LOW QUALITY PROTEIN: SLC2A4 regulator [Corvus kubaryi]